MDLPIIETVALLGNMSLDAMLPNPERHKTEPSTVIESPCLDCHHGSIYNGICILCDSEVDQTESRSFDCHHGWVCNEICCFCNSKVDKTGNISFDYLGEGTKMSHEVALLTKQVISEKSWLEDKKLHLVLDLDHTLVHSVSVSHLSKSGKRLTQEAESRKDLWRYKIGERGELLIKLRPFLHQFLEEAKEMFSMYIYTMGGYEYARYAAELIDPEKCYFGERIITRRESPDWKTLDLVLADERGVVIVDDMPHAWPHHKRNLLQISQYSYFKESQGFYSASDNDESEENGRLAKALRFLKEVHKGFFSAWSEENSYLVDVRPLLRDPATKSKRKQIRRS